MMFSRWQDALGGSARQFALPVTVLMVAAFAGMATAVVGSLAGYRAVYFVAIFGLVVMGGMVAVTRPEPLRFVFLALIACFPVALAAVPPARFGLTVFDVVMYALMIGLIGRKLFASASASEPLFPTVSLSIAWLLSIPCVVFSQYPLVSLQAFILIFAIYAFFLYTLGELRRERGLERLVLLLSSVVIVMAIGLFVDRVLHVNLSMRGSNVNQLSYASGLEIYRAGGFFQDPQKGGAFLSCLITFLLLLAIRGRFRGATMRLVVWTAIGAGSAALVTTISRSAILACLLVSGLALFAFNRWNAAVKLVIIGGLMLVAMGIALTPVETWMNIVPATVKERFATLRTDFEIRREIWFDTWSMFADHPLTGIGPSSFKPYLIATKPTVFSYYDIGTAAGVGYVPDQPENGYLKILYEGGIAGSIAVLLVVGDALRRVLAVIAGSNTNADARTEAIAALAGLLNFGLTFVTLFTVSDARIAAIFAFLLAVVWHRSLPDARVGTKA